MTRTTKMMAPIVIAIWILLPLVERAVYAQVCTMNPPQGPVAIYDEFFLPGWSTSGSWNIATPVNMQAAPGGQDGNRAMQVDFTANWGGVELHRTNVGTTFLDSIVFRVRQEGTGVLYAGIRLTSNNMLHNWVAVGSYITPNQTIVMTPGKWYTVRIPLADMGVATGASINGVLIESSSPMTTYLDDIGIVTALLRFPLSGTGTTPYNAPITAILDHSVDNSVDTSQRNHGYYHRNGIIQAYNDEKANAAFCHYYDLSSNGTYICDGSDHSIMGYLNDNSGATQFNIPLLNFQAQDPLAIGPKSTLWYDGHSGYDYPAAPGTAITAATDGILCVASNRTSLGETPWRNPTMCPYGTDPVNGPVNGDSWDTWHMFYVVYPNEYNGVTYSTWYLHSNDLEDTINKIRTSIMSNGYANVRQGDVVATVGSTGVGSNYHLHFEVRANGTKEVDPYGDGSPGSFHVLWQTRPQ